MSEFVKDYALLFDRDIQRLIEEIEAFDKEENLWLTIEGISNSAGNLALHLAGNLSSFIGHFMGDHDYERDREREFNASNVPKEKILQEINDARSMVASTLKNITESRLNDAFPKPVLGYEMTNTHFIVHLYGHLNYHLGQINYLRRILP